MSKRKPKITQPDPIQEARKSIKRKSRSTVDKDSAPNFKEILDSFNPSEVLKRNFQRTVMDVKPRAMKHSQWTASASASIQLLRMAPTSCQ